MSLATTLAGLALALAGFELVGRLADALDRPSAGLSPHVRKWLVPTAVVAFVLLVEGRSLASIGLVWNGPLRFAGEVIVGSVLLLGTNVVTQPLWARLEGKSGDAPGDGGDDVDAGATVDGSGDVDRGGPVDGGVEAGLASFAGFSIPQRLFVAATAGVTEEVPYRGYAIERLAALTGSPILAGAVSVVAFVAAHYGEVWDRSSLPRLAQPAVLLTVLYLLTRSLPVVIAVHTLNNAVGLLLADRFAE